MTVVYGHPFPGYFYPPPPRGSRRKKGKQPSSRAIDREVRFTSPDKPRKNQINNRKRSEPVRNGYRRSRPREDLFDPDQNDILQRYQVGCKAVPFIAIGDKIILLVIENHLHYKQTHIFNYSKYGILKNS